MRVPTPAPAATPVPVTTPAPVAPKPAAPAAAAPKPAPSTGTVTTAATTCSGCLSADDVSRVLRRAAAQARANGVVATIAVVDRVGNVLGVLRMTNMPNNVQIGDNTRNFGLHNLVLPRDLAALGVLPANMRFDALAAISKAVTGAYLSSRGNGFTTRTASQIVQQHFNPHEPFQPGGPLYGVQFSSLPCSDFNTRFGGDALRGPKRSPLGLAADPGGFPLYKSNVLVGGIGVITNRSNNRATTLPQYGLDANFLDIDTDLDELAALAGTFEFPTPEDIRAARITVDGRTLRYSDVTASSIAPAALVAPAALPPISSFGQLLTVKGYNGTVNNSAGTIIAGTTFGAVASGYARSTSVAPFVNFGGLDAFVLTNAAGQNRFPPTASPTGLITAPQVQNLLTEALRVAFQARAQIRRPLNSFMQVTVSVVDIDGRILGVARTPDAPVFGTDVSLQKARSALFLSRPTTAASLLASATPVLATLNRGQTMAQYLARARSFIGPNIFQNGIAFGARSIGNIERPFYPDGTDGNASGPLSTPNFATWSPFSTGFQLDIFASDLVQHLQFSGNVAGATDPAVCGSILPPRTSRTGVPAVRPLQNGLQIFAGGVPIFRGGTLIGAIGISGDGIDQDDMVAFLGTHNAGVRVPGSVNNAPNAIRADRLTPQGVRLRYVSCPQRPFLNTNVQNVCEGK
ncbi:heme-binding protein [Zavarzinia sp. CC-PAN008]|uniref:heme-binding protein n=1 Tax=Zavarzinia sp. CC-PAN008 TaxID=3243332 RepID=UPI003F746F86